MLDAIADTDVAEVRAQRTQSETARLVAEVAKDEALLGRARSPSSPLAAVSLRVGQQLGR